MTGEARGEPLLSDHPVALRMALLLWGLGGVLFSALQVPGLRSVTQAIDDWIHGLVVDIELAPLDGLAEILDFVGSSWVTSPLLVAVAGASAVVKGFSRSTSGHIGSPTSLWALHWGRRLPLGWQP